jgi:hypothetical protein
MSCGVWLLAADVSFEHVKVGLTPVSKLKVPPPRFPLSCEDEEDNTSFLARVEQEARTIVGSYMRAEHEACIAGLQNNGHLNRVLKLAGVAYGPHPAPVSTEVLKKRKADACGKVLAKRPKAPEKKGTEPTKVAGACAKGGLKQPSDADILPTKSAKLSKGIVPPTQLLLQSWRALHLKRAIQYICSMLQALKPVGGAQALKAYPEQRRLLHPLRSASFQLLGLWLRYLRRGLRNHHHMIRHPKFNRKQASRSILGASTLISNDFGAEV